MTFDGSSRWGNDSGRPARWARLTGAAGSTLVLLAYSALWAASCASTCPRPGTPAVSQQETTAPLSEAAQAARKLHVPGSVLALGPIRDRVSGKLVDRGTATDLARFLDGLEHHLVRDMKASVQASEEIELILAEHKRSAQRLFDAQGRAEIGKFLPNKVIILGWLNGRQLHLKALDLEKAVTLRSTIVRLRSSAPEYAAFLSSLEQLRGSDGELEVVITEFLRKYPGNLTLRELNSALSHVESHYVKSRILQLATREGLLFVE